MALFVYIVALYFVTYLVLRGTGKVHNSKLQTITMLLVILELLVSTVRPGFIMIAVALFFGVVHLLTEVVKEETPSEQ